MLSPAYSETLSELLSQLDSLYDNHGATANTDLLRFETENVAPVPLQTPSTRKKGRNVKITGLPYSIDLQRRRKAELLSLRVQEQQLNNKLKYLVPGNDTLSVGQAVESSDERHEQLKWRNQAMLNSEQRGHAERHNQELKAELVQHFKLFNSMRKVLGNHRQGMKFVVQPQPTADRPFYQVDYSKPMLEELTSNLARMYLGTDEIMPPLSSNLSLVFHSQTKLRWHCESFVNTTSITPLACTVQDAGDILWRYIIKDGYLDVQSFNFSQVKRSDEGQMMCTRSYITHLFLTSSGLDAPLYASALSAFKKVESEGQVDLVGTMRWILPAEGLRFEDQHWTVIEPSPMDPKHSSVVRTYYQLEERCTGMELTNQQKLSRDLVMKLIAKMSHQYLQLLQNAFLDQSGTAGTY